MIDILIDDIYKSYGDNNVLRGISFPVQSGEHMALLGANGAGKTTLFRILSGEESPDKGSFTLAPGKIAGILSQIPVYPAEFQGEDVLREAFAPLLAIEQEMAALTACMTDEPEALKRYGALEQSYELLGGYEQDLRYRRVCQGLGISEDLRFRPFNSLSGGEKTRLNLGRLMLQNADVLLLDEPTNHLDVSAVEWLEDYLRSYPGTVLLISHDRFFLDNTVTRVAELENGQVTLWNGNYSAYAAQKEQKFQDELKLYEVRRREQKRLEDVARRMHDYAGKNAKLHRRAFAIEKRASRIPQSERPRRQAQLRQKFTARPFQADDLLTARELRKSYGDRVIVQSANLAIAPGERIALLGDNGVGKTTLLHLLLGITVPDNGTVRLSERCKTAHLPQVVHFDHPERSLLDTLLYDTDCTTQQARDRLGGFHFFGDEVFKTVNVLSGGERSRLRLAVLMSEEINFLTLDEPTNHLDISSREWLESALENYDGTLLFISHDRYFISRFATRIWHLKNGEIEDFDGGYEEYRQWLELSRDPQTPTSAPPQAPPPKKPASRDSKADDRRRRVLERELEEHERRERELEQQLMDSGSDAGLALDLLAQKEEVNRQWQACFAEWERYVANDI